MFIDKVDKVVFSYWRLDWALQVEVAPREKKTANIEKYAHFTLIS